MISLKSKKEIEAMREGGRILAEVLRRVSHEAKPGTKTSDLDRLARELIFSSGARPAFLGYKPGGSGEGYPAAVCISVNDEIVHGLPGEKKILFEGDIVKLDCGVEYKNIFTDATVMVGVGKISKKAEKIMRVTKECLELGIGEIRPGATLNEYAKAVENHAREKGFEVVRDLVGHGVGHAVHEAPQVFNYADPRMKKIILREGMALALEPMVNEGTFEIVLSEDGWTYLTRDGKLNGHWEHTIVVTKGGCEIITDL
ncbi:MAG: type I methionyl aminopeptidase [Candidatus Moranbacteria bacterium]|nr:type I methionyl aminopeptidase [Candidatus Moranbacteria bacterium]